MTARMRRARNPRINWSGSAGPAKKRSAHASCKDFFRTAYRQNELFALLAAEGKEILLFVTHGHLLRMDRMHRYRQECS